MGAIVSAIVGGLLAAAVGVFGVNQLTAAPAPVDQPYIVYGEG